MTALEIGLNARFAGQVRTLRKALKIRVAPPSKLSELEFDLDQTQSRLNRLERHEWWRWCVAFVIMLALTFGLFALSIPIGGRTWVEQAELNAGLRSLLALVLLFDVFVIYQQVLIGGLRRDLATQLRVITTLETLKKSDDDTLVPRKERRRIPRSRIDQRVRVNIFDKGEASCVHGRIRDISESGLGAVIPHALAIGEQVTLEFSVERGQEGTVAAVVTHRQGFHYGFDFVYIEPSLRKAIGKKVEEFVAAGTTDAPTS